MALAILCTIISQTCHVCDDVPSMVILYPDMMDELISFLLYILMCVDKCILVLCMPSNPNEAISDNAICGYCSILMDGGRD